MSDGNNDWEATAKVVPELRFLKMLVTGLALVMGLGMVALVTLLWVRLGQPVLPELPGTIDLPANTQAEAITFAKDWIVVVTDAGEVLLYDRQGELHSRTAPQ